MITIQATYDGKNFKPLPSEQVPEVNREIPVAIIFLEEVPAAKPPQKSQRAIAEEMWAARAKMQPLGMSITEMIEEGRER